MDSVPFVTYEEAVRRLRGKPGSEDLIRACYLDENTLIAAERFRESEEFAAVLEILSRTAPPSARVLDLGCGNGISSFAFAHAGYSVVGVDPDESAIVGLGAARALASACPATVSFQRAYAEQLPFASGEFDVVYARQCLHHLNDLDRGVAECARVLRPGGIFIACREHVVSDSIQLVEFLRAHPLHHWHGGEMAYPVLRYRDALSRAGLANQVTLGPFDTPINHFPIQNHEIETWLGRALKRRLGSVIGDRLKRVSSLQRLYRNLLTRRCTEPGRLYSFIGHKSAGVSLQ